LSDLPCFLFHAVLDQINYRSSNLRNAVLDGMGASSMTYQHLRCLAVGGIIKLAMDGDELIISHTNLMSKYVQEASRDTAWADEMMTAVLCRVLGITIVLINSDDSDPTILHGGNNAILYLGYEVGRHFQSTRDTPDDGLVARVRQVMQNPLPTSSRISLSDAYTYGRSLVDVGEADSADSKGMCVGV
jgi:hypothetical protein